LEEDDDYVMLIALKVEVVLVDNKVVASKVDDVLDEDYVEN
jgi:hypothetical protein